MGAGRLVADPAQYGPEGNARQLQCGAFEFRSVAILPTRERQRDPVETKQRLEARVGIVALGRDLDLDAVAFAGVGGR